MGRDSKISWTRETWNPWQGCDKVSEGCKFCYMMRDKARWKQDGSIVVRSSDAKFYEPRTYVHPTLVFTCSWSDWFHKDADGWRSEAWKIVRNSPSIFQILTKRSDPDYIRERLPEDWGDGYPNVWLGVSVEKNNRLKRITDLLQIPARVRFVSFEPLLESLDLTDPLTKFNILSPEYGRLFSEINPGIHWAIIGGESGNDTGDWNYRDCKIEWIHDLVRQILEADVAPWMKQVGTAIAKRGRAQGYTITKAGEDWGELLKLGLVSLLYREFPKNIPEEQKEIIANLLPL